MKPKELTKTLMISNCSKNFDHHGLYKNIPDHKITPVDSSRNFGVALDGSLHLKNNINPLTAGAAYIRAFICYKHIKYHILNMLKIKYDINQHNLKTVDLHFVKSE